MELTDISYNTWFEQIKQTIRKTTNQNSSQRKSAVDGNVLAIS